MKRKNATRNALFTSIISLLLCVSMLVGTTFAWFTDSVVSGQNVIAAGNLDVELFHSDKDNSGYVNTTTKLFNDITLWEPGVVAYENFRVENVGNLALQYQLSINFDNATDNGNGGTLADVLKVAVVEGGFNGNRADAQKLTGYTALKSFALNGKLEGSEISETYGIVIYWEPSDNDNDYNMNNGKTGVLSIDLGVNLFATQEMYEEDSFGEDYDALASDWDGSVGEVPAEQEGVITLTTGAELAAFAAEVNSGNSYSGKTVKLGADINLGNIAWTPIGDCESGAYFQGTFDGQGYTIYNLNVDHSTDASAFASAGLFGWVDAAMATVKNVNIDGATVKGSHWVGVIAGYFTGTIENCSVNDATVIAYNLNDDANGDKVGGIVGCLNEHGYINNNTVTNSTITGNRDIGGIAGSVAASTYEMKNNKVENTVITYATTKDYGSAGAIVSGRTGYVANDTNIATNVTIVHSIADAAGLKSALAAGKTEIYIGTNITLTEGLTASNVTLIGLGEDAGINFAGHNITGSGTITYKNLDLSTVSLPNIPANGERYGWYGGIDYAGHTVANYENCTITGVFTTYSQTVNANGCTFNSYVQDGEEFYNIFMYGNGTVNATNCTFMYRDRAIKIYSEGANAFELNITGGQFVATSDYTVNKALINVDSTYFTSATINVNGVTIDEKLASASLHNAEGNSKVTVTVTE